MTQIIKDIHPSEKGTAVVTMAFTDENGDAVVPTGLAWQLMRPDGTVVNSNTFALNTFTGTQVVLGGDDLVFYDDGDSGDRVFSVQGVYNSTLGTGLHIKDELRFAISNLLGQTDQVT